MRLNRLIYAAGLGLLLLSCNRSKELVLAPEYLPDVTDQKVISSMINERNNTIAIIYGNDLALQAASGSTNLHQPGERYTMVTWKQKPMPNWYGTTMNGEILAVERVNVSQDIHGQLSFSYHLQSPSHIKAGRQPINKNQQINFIISQSAAVFP